MDKWEKLKTLIDADLSYTVHYSSDKNYEHSQLIRVKEWMGQLEKGEPQKGFLFTDIPEFDKSTWNRMLTELQGLS
jgi:hypothetical protein